MSEKRVTVIGSYLSPYVRKALVCLELKGVTYEIDPIIPYFGNAAFSKLSPLRRIPVLLDGDLVLTDSSVICEYLEETHPAPALLPSNPADRARCRWLEEFADTRMGDVFIWRYYNQLVIRKRIWKRPPDQEVLDYAIEVEIPGILDYLETQVSGAAWLFDEISVADIAIASFFRNAAFAGFEMNAEAWPRTAAFVTHVLAHPVFQKLTGFEDLMMRVPLEERRQELLKAGAPLTTETYASDTPQPGYFYT